MEAGEIAIPVPVRAVTRECDQTAVTQAGRELEHDTRDLRAREHLFNTGRREEAYHDDKRVPPEEPPIHIRQKSHRKRAHRRRNIILIRERSRHEMIRNPPNTRQAHQQHNLLPIPRRVIPQRQKQRVHRHKQEVPP